MHMNVHEIGPEKVNIEYTAQMRSKTELIHSVYVSSNICTKGYQITNSHMQQSRLHNDASWRDVE